MRHKRKLTLILALTLLLTACPSEKSSKYREATKASDRIATSIGGLIDLKRSLAAQGLITPQEELQLTNLLLDANRAGRVFNDTAKSFKSDTPENRRALLALFTDLSASIGRLNDQGVLHIKNPQARTLTSNVVASVNASLQIINAALQ